MAAACSAVCWGCGPGGGTNPSLVPVKGKVTYKGMPLTKGTIKFVPDGYGREARGAIQSDGSFVLTTQKEGDGAVAGEHRVAITGFDKGLAKDRALTKFASPNTSRLIAEVDPEHTEFNLRASSRRRSIAGIGPRAGRRGSPISPIRTSDTRELSDMTSRLPRPLRLAVFAALIASAPALARADDFRLEGATLPAPLVDAAGKVDVTIEASGVEPIGDGHRILVAHDKHPALFVVDVATGCIVGEPITSAKFPEPSKLGGPKWEGMARDAEGNYYIIGAHVGKTDEERASKSVLLRFRLKDSDQPAIDDASVVRWDISRSLESVLKAERLDPRAVGQRKIEGLAIRESRKPDGSACREMAIGLRAPTDKVRAFVADITATPSPESEVELKPLFTFQADPREGFTSELTSMEHIPALGGFLVVTASEDETNAFHGNTLWFVADGIHGPARKIATFEVAMKAEGLTALGTETDGSRTSVKLLITYDNDPHATKIPSRFQTATLVREAR